MADVAASQDTPALKPASLTILEVPGKTPAEIEANWYRDVYQGDAVPQLTLRAVLMGAVLGFLMCLSNLYVGLKVGWGLGVVVTAIILSFVIYSGLVRLAPKLFGPNMSLLENNAMASTASAAGYSTGATIVSATAAYLMLMKEHIPWTVLVPWTFFISGLGVFLAIPMKRQMVNIEQLKFPTGTAAAVTLRSLYASGEDARQKARALGIAGGIGAVIAWLRDGMSSISAFAERKLFIPAHTPLPGSLGGVPLEKLTLSLENSLIMVGAGAIMGLRVTLSMMLGAFICYGVLAPKMYELGAIKDLTYRGITSWGLWTGVSLMVVSSLLQFAMQGNTIVRAFKGLASVFDKNAGRRDDDPLAAIEVPVSWFIIGFTIMAIGSVVVAKLGFDIPIHYAAIAVLLSAVLCIVACRATGETDITPVGPLGKITQLLYGVLMPQNMTANLMNASITGNSAVGAADLLSDLKSGYLLGANPRKQFWAQFIGCIIGTMVIVPFFYILVPTPDALGGDRFPAPAAQVWAAVAKLLSTGFSALHPTAQLGMYVGAGIGLALPLLELALPKNARQWVPSAMGLGLAFVIPGWNSISMALGALIAWGVDKWNKDIGERFTIPIASGLIAGESLIGVLIAVLAAVGILS